MWIILQYVEQIELSNGYIIQWLYKYIINDTNYRRKKE